MKTVLPLALFLLLLPASRAQAASCGQVTIKGCCTSATLSFCQAGALKQVDCTSQPSCGWDAKLNYYACGTQGGADPSGKHPKSCPATSDAGGATPDASAAGDGPGLDLPPAVLDSGVRYDLGVQWDGPGDGPGDGLGGDVQTLPPPDSSGACNLGGGAVDTLALLPVLLLLLVGRRS
jgi:hypothetical protein